MLKLLKLAYYVCFVKSLCIKWKLVLDLFWSHCISSLGSVSSR